MEVSSYIDYCGISNEGATCYINSLLQSLFYTNEFRDLIYNTAIDSEDVNDSFVFWLKYIFYALQSGGLTKISTKKLIQTFNWDGMTTTDQQDIQEFLRLLMDKIDQFLFGSEHQNRLRDLFVGDLKTTIKCKSVDYSTSNTETFWDIQLPIDEDSDIYSAFQTYLKSTTITGYQYDDDDKRDDAIQEIEFIKLPPVLHIQLQRFKFNLKSHILTKNNKKFEFHRELDLSRYCADAIYTLHSVLAHSGTANAGHYTAFISPQANDQWFKFNDEIVTGCSLDDAINQNYGNGARKANAYMLVYIKDSCSSRVLREVSLDDVISKEMIEDEMRKTAEEQLKQDQCYEIVVFTQDTLEMCSAFERGKSLFNRKCAVKDSFYIEKNRKFGDLIQLFVDSLGLPSQKSFRVWMINVNKNLIRLCDIQTYSDELLKTLFKKNIGHFFIELTSEEDTMLFPFEKNKHALIFIKQYDPVNNKLSYFGHHFFKLSQRAQDIRTYIRDSIQFDGRAERIELVFESGVDEDYSHSLLQSKDVISKFAIKNIDTFSATLVFEIVENDCKITKYLRFANASSEERTSQRIRSENAISVTIKQNTSTGEELLTQDFQPDFKLSELVEQLSIVYNQSGYLIDAENNTINRESLNVTIQDYLEQKNERNIVHARTRSQAKKVQNLEFSYKFGTSDMQVEPMEQTDESASYMDFCSTSYGSMNAVPMECQSQLIVSNPIGLISMLENSSKNAAEFIANIDGVHDQASGSENFGINNEKNDTFEHRSFGENITKPSTHSTPKADKITSVYLAFCDRSGKRSEVELQFNADELLDTAFNQISDVMDLVRHRSHFFDSNGEEIPIPYIYSTTVGEFLLNNGCARIQYEENVTLPLHTHDSYHENLVPLSMQRISKTGREIGIVIVPINDTKTIGDVCSEYGNCRVVQLKNGIIRSIVRLDVKLFNLVGDRFKYRIDTIDTFLENVVEKNADAFHVCIRFVKQSPEYRLKIPMLIKVRNGMSVWLLGNIVCKTLTTGEKDLNMAKNFEFESDCIRTCPNANVPVLVKPDNPETIPVILLNMGVAKSYNYGRLSYSYNLPDWK